MKTVICIVLSIFCVSCNGQNIRHAKENKTATIVTTMDTLSILSLHNKQYVHRDYKISHLCNMDRDGYRIDSTRRIELTENNKTLTTIRLPIPDEDVKNFSVSKIAETRSGFKIVVNWGGGNYFYSREFCFTFKSNQFYLDSFRMSSFIQEPEKETKAIKKICPPTPIGKFNILHYLENE